MAPIKKVALEKGTELLPISSSQQILAYNPDLQAISNLFNRLDKFPSPDLLNAEYCKTRAEIFFHTSLLYNSHFTSSEDTTAFTTGNTYIHAEDVQKNFFRQYPDSEKRLIPYAETYTKEFNRYRDLVISNDPEVLEALPSLVAAHRQFQESYYAELDKISKRDKAAVQILPSVGQVGAVKGAFFSTMDRLGDFVLEHVAKKILAGSPEAKTLALDLYISFLVEETDINCPDFIDPSLLQRARQATSIPTCRFGVSWYEVNNALCGIELKVSDQTAEVIDEIRKIREVVQWGRAATFIEALLNHFQKQMKIPLNSLSPVLNLIRKYKSFFSANDRAFTEMNINWLACVLYLLSDEPISEKIISDFRFFQNFQEDKARYEKLTEEEKLDLMSQLFKNPHTISEKSTDSPNFRLLKRDVFYYHARIKMDVIRLVISLQRIFTTGSIEKEYRRSKSNLTERMIGLAQSKNQIAN